VNVSAQPRVVSQVPADIIGIRINHDVVPVPKPAVNIAQIIGGDAEKEAAKPEAVRAASLKPPYMMRAIGSGEASMLPGVIKMVVLIISALVVPHPLIVARMDVGRFGVTRVVVEFAGILVGMGVPSPARLWGHVRCRRRTVSGNVASANFGMAGSALLMTTLGMWATLRMTAALRLTTALCGGKDRNREQHYQDSNISFHAALRRKLGLAIRAVASCQYAEKYTLARNGGR
jgi:hypothetical protein